MPTQISGFWIDQTAYTLAASASVKQGQFACNDSGKVKAATDALIQGGAPFLGVAHEDYVEATGSDATRKMLFFRNCSAFVPGAKGGDVPTTANVGGPVYVATATTIKKTGAAGDQAVTLLEIVPGGGYRVLVP